MPSKHEGRVSPHRSPSRRRNRSSEYVVVAIRLRGGIEVNSTAVAMKDRSCCVQTDRKQVKTVTVDYCLNDTTNQQDLYEKLGRSLVDNTWNGINSSLLAYGQTGSGKTYSIFGPPELPGSELFREGAFHSEAGLVPRLFNDIFCKVSNSSQTHIIEISLLEVYLERVFDLLRGREQVPIRGTNEHGFFAEGLTKRRVKSYSDVFPILREGYAQMSMAGTAQNLTSSRAHTILEVSIRRADSSKSSKITIVDLAGSEDVKRTDAQGELLLQAANINSSLMELGILIERIVDGSNSRAEPYQVSYRGSTLTKLLKDSLGGNTKATLLVNISPKVCDSVQTLNSLRFADRAKHLRNPPTAESFFVENSKVVQSNLLENENEISHLFHGKQSRVHQNRDPKHVRSEDSLSRELECFKLLDLQSKYEEDISNLMNKQKSLSAIISDYVEKTDAEGEREEEFILTTSGEKQLRDRITRLENKLNADALSSKATIAFLQLEVETRGLELLEAGRQISVLQYDARVKHKLTSSTTVADSLLPFDTPDCRSDESSLLTSSFDTERSKLLSLINASSAQIADLTAEVARGTAIISKQDTDLARKLKSKSELTAKYQIALDTEERENFLLKNQVRDLRKEVSDLTSAMAGFEDREKQHREERQGWKKKYSSLIAHVVFLHGSAVIGSTPLTSISHSFDPYSDLDDCSSISHITTPGSGTPPLSSPLAATIPQSCTPPSQFLTSKHRWEMRRKERSLD